MYGKKWILLMLHQGKNRPKISRSVFTIIRMLSAAVIHGVSASRHELKKCAGTLAMRLPLNKEEILRLVPERGVLLRGAHNILSLAVISQDFLFLFFFLVVGEGNIESYFSY